MVVKLNGEDMSLDEAGPAPVLAEILRRARCPQAGVAVAVNRVVVPRAAWDLRLLRQGDEIEVVTATQGG
ncbi:MAG: sulfur carrier protein ThiS [Acidimicrobiales bacterium]